MKAALRAFLQYSHVERMAFVIIGALLVVLLLIRCSLSWWIETPQPDARQTALLNAEYRAWLALQDAEDGHTIAPVLPTESFAFDPNTLDSAGFLRLGMPPRAVKGLLNWRRKGKHFYRAEDLQPLYNLPPEIYTRIAPLVRIERPGAGNRFQQNALTREAGPETIELNTADSATLDRRVPGIGAVLARKIVARREALGGYLNLEQLLEVYKFPDTTMSKLRQRLTLNPETCRLMDLNGVTQERLSAHPYIGEKVAKNIVVYREALGGYMEITQLRQVPLMTAENYRKIAPYFTPPRSR